MKKIEFYKHNLTPKDIRACVSVLKSFFLTTGQSVEEFEKKFSDYLSVKYAIGVNSCTDALFLSLKGLGIKDGDEVITTPLSFIATSNAIEYCGAKPVFVDVEEKTGNINADLIEKAVTKKTKAVLPVHLYGQMCDMIKIKKISRKHKLKIIEDSAHCIEGIRDGIRPGQLSDAACFSFYATKNITSGEGGAIVTNDKKLYEWLIKARLHGMNKDAKNRYHKKYEHYDMEFLGYKSNMSNIQASLLTNQLKRIEKHLSRKEELYKRYEVGFKNSPNIKTMKLAPNTKHARLLYTILVKEELRDLTISKLQDKGIGIAVNFRPIHLMKYYKNKYNYSIGGFPNAEIIGNSTISLPFYPKLTIREQQYIIKTLNKITS